MVVLRTSICCQRMFVVMLVLLPDRCGKRGLVAVPVMLSEMERVGAVPAMVELLMTEVLLRSAASLPALS